MNLHRKAQSGTCVGDDSDDFFGGGVGASGKVELQREKLLLISDSNLHSVKTPDPVLYQCPSRVCVLKERKLLSEGSNSCLCFSPILPLAPKQSIPGIAGTCSWLCLAVPCL